MKLTIRDIVFIGLLSALCAVGTTIRVEIPGAAMVHMGSATIFTTSILFGGMYGGLGAAIGSALFDLVTGKTAYLFFSIVIKGFCGIIIGYLTVGYLPPKMDTKKVTVSRMFFAMIVGAIWTAIGYFFAWWYVLESVTTAFFNIQFSLYTSLAGIVVALIVAPKLQGIVRQLNK